MDLLLGPGAAAPQKLETGNPLVVLGVQCTVAESGVTFATNPAKAQEWAHQIQAYLEMGMLTAGDASKLAGESKKCQQELARMLPIKGRLGFASQHIFHRLGRALLVPLYKQIRSRSAAIDEELRMALQWWLQTLQRLV